MVRSGEVVENNGDVLTVVFERPAACTNCGGCLNKECTNIQIPGSAQVGDAVDVAMPDKNVVGASMIAYIIPLIGLLGGLFAGGWLHGILGISFSADLFAALCGGVLLGIGLLVVYAIDRNLRKKQDWQPHIVAVHPRESVKAQQ